MEFCPGGSVATLLRSFGAFPEPVLAQYSRQLMEGIAYIHEHQVLLSLSSLSLLSSLSSRARALFLSLPLLSSLSLLQNHKPKRKQRQTTDHAPRTTERAYGRKRSAGAAFAMRASCAGCALIGCRCAMRGLVECQKKEKSQKRQKKK
jgi:hypothetical protein